jgi:hypothetical protein
MTPKKTKAFAFAAMAAFAAIAGYWYWSPLLSVRQLQSAAVERDASAFNRHVDYPKVRASIKGQFSPMFADQPGQPADAGGSGAAFGKKMGMGMVNRYVDGALRPDMLMRSVTLGQLSRSPRNAPKDQALADKSPWHYERQGVNQVLAHVVGTGRSDDAQPPLGMVLQRSGFATWKLTQVLLPVATR